MLHFCGMFKPLHNFSITCEKGQVNQAAGEQEESLNNHDSGAEDNVDQQMNSQFTYESPDTQPRSQDLYPRFGVSQARVKVLGTRLPDTLKSFRLLLQTISKMQ